jgi:hypothetical protein
MPFLGKIGMRDRKAVRFHRSLATATWATAAVGSVVNARLPFVVVLCRTFPPDSLSTTSREILWSKIGILCRMPFGSYVWMRSR